MNTSIEGEKSLCMVCGEMVAGISCSGGLQACEQPKTCANNELSRTLTPWISRMCREDVFGNQIVVIELTMTQSTLSAEVSFPLNPEYNDTFHSYSLATAHAESVCRKLGYSV